MAGCGQLAARPEEPSAILVAGQSVANRFSIDGEVPCVAGASFFYKPGTLPYEAQEVRAFGLFLNDMLVRLEGADKACGASKGLEEILADALRQDPHSRPTFQAIVARCSVLTKVPVISSLALCAEMFCRSSLGTHNVIAS